MGDKNLRTEVTRLCVWVSGHAVLLMVVLVCVSIEGALQGADLGFWGSPHWRGQAYAYGGFWRGLLGTWQPNYPFQPVLMFVSYGFLHSGFMHLLFNMIALISFGRLVIEQIGQQRFAFIYGITLLSGAGGFALFSRAVQPMVGASGALFGIVGLLISWEYTERRGAGKEIAPVLKMIAFLTALNGGMYWMADGALAWETHLGGFLAGYAAGWWFPSRHN